MNNGPLTTAGAVHGTMPSSQSSEMSEATETMPCDKLTHEQTKKWEDTTAMIQWCAPGFRHIWYKLLVQNGNEYNAVMTRRVPVAACDGQNLLINPDKFFDYALRERAFIGAHEVLHAIFDDCSLLHRCGKSGTVPMNDGTTLPFHNETMQIAMDLRNNALLIESKIGACPKDACVGGREVAGVEMPKVTGNESVLDIYQSVYKKFDENGGQPGDGVIIDVLQPGTSTGQTPQQATQQRNPQRWAIELQSAQTLQERHQGKLPGGLQRMFQQLLEPEVYWLDHIETLIQRHTGSGGRDWREPDPWYIGRDIYLPKKTGYGAGWIVVWGDTSGSRGDAELASNMSELGAIIEDINPKRLTVLWCDASVDYVDEIEDPSDLANIQARGTGGGGGTSFEPVLEWIGQQGETPELFIGFTDGYVNYPDQEPPFPTIWASSTDYNYPYGQKVRVNKRAAG